MAHYVMRRPVGWRYESVRHSLAARGVPTGRRYAVWKRYDAGLEKFGDPEFGGSLATRGATLLVGGKGPLQPGTGNIIQRFMVGTTASPYASATPGLFKYPITSVAGQMERFGRVGETALYGVTNLPFSVGQFDPYTGKGAWIGQDIAGGVGKVPTLFGGKPWWTTEGTWMERTAPLTKQIKLAPAIAEKTGFAGSFVESMASDPLGTAGIYASLGAAGAAARGVGVVAKGPGQYFIKSGGKLIPVAKSTAQEVLSGAGLGPLMRSAPLLRVEQLVAKTLPASVRAAAGRAAATEASLQGLSIWSRAGEKLATPAVWAGGPLQAMTGGIVFNPLTIASRAAWPTSEAVGYSGLPTNVTGVSGGAPAMMPEMPAPAAQPWTSVTGGLEKSSVLESIKSSPYARSQGYVVTE